MTITYTDAQGERQEAVLEPATEWHTDPVLRDMHTFLGQRDRIVRLESEKRALLAANQELRSVIDSLLDRRTA